MREILAWIVSFLKSLPLGILAVLVFLGGWIGATFLRFIMWKLLDLVRFNKLCDRMGISEFLRKGQVSRQPSILAGIIVYWAALLVTLLEISRVLDIKVVNSFSERLTAIVPGLIAGAFVGIIGLVVVAFIGNFVMTVARNAGFPHAALLARVVKTAGYVLVAVFAFAQMDLGRTVINAMLQILFAAIAFGLALAFGLGCKDIARDAVVRLLQNLREKRRTDGRSDLEG